MGHGPDPSHVVRRSESVVSERFASETLVLDLTGDRYVRLNETGSRLWDALETPARPDELAAVLVAEWDLAPERAHDDVRAFLTMLADRGLVELEQP